MAAITGEFDRITAAMKVVADVICAYAVWSDDGEGAVFVLYASEAAADAGVATAQEIWGSITPHLSGPPDVTGFSNVHQMR